MASCDLHVHTVFSTDSGNFALRRARLGESFTSPDRVYETCLARGMTLVTISDHNTVEGALRIAGRPGAFLSVEVTTRFPEDDVPLHVLVWNLSEEDHRDLQAYRPSVYELAAFLRDRNLHHALAHPLYRMGVPLRASHVERMMLLFAVWEGRNGARPEGSNLLACRLAAAATPDYLSKLAERHGIEPTHTGPIGVTGGSDDHGALDIATTYTDAGGDGVDEFLAAVSAGEGAPRGEHGSAVKLAHAVGALALNAYRAQGRELPSFLADGVAPLFDARGAGPGRHDDIVEASATIARLLGEQARSGGVGLDALPTLGRRAGALLLAGGVELPYLSSLRHHAGTRRDVDLVEQAFFGLSRSACEARSLVFTDTYSETNGVAGTMRRLAGLAAAGEVSLKIVTAGSQVVEAPGVISLEVDWSFPLPAYTSLELNFPLLTKVLARVEAEAPDVIHVATPGPIGLCGLAAAKLLELPLVGSYHTELGPYALRLTEDALVSDTLSLYVDWFYRQCGQVLAPTHAVAEQLRLRGLEGRVSVWGRGVDASAFTPERRSEELRRRLLEPGLHDRSLHDRSLDNGSVHDGIPDNRGPNDGGPTNGGPTNGGELLFLSVGRVSREKRLDVLLQAFERLRAHVPGARLVIAGDGPAREALELEAPGGVRFVGELHGDPLAELYASADVFCFPSTTDTFGQVLLEAGASGLPVVAAAAGGAPELVKHGSNGLLVRPDDPIAFADALHTLAISPVSRARLGVGARDAATARSWHHSLQELRAAYALAAGRELTFVKEPLHV